MALVFNSAGPNGKLISAGLPTGNSQAGGQWIWDASGNLVYVWNGGDQADTLDFSRETNRVMADGGDGNDEIVGGTADDQLFGGDGNDRLDRQCR